MEELRCQDWRKFFLQVSRSFSKPLGPQNQLTNLSFNQIERYFGTRNICSLIYFLIFFTEYKNLQIFLLSLFIFRPLWSKGPTRFHRACLVQWIGKAIPSRKQYTGHWKAIGHFLGKFWWKILHFFFFFFFTSNRHRAIYCPLSCHKSRAWSGSSANYDEIENEPWSITIVLLDEKESQEGTPSTTHQWSMRHQPGCYDRCANRQMASLCIIWLNRGLSAEIPRRWSHSATALELRETPAILTGKSYTQIWIFKGGYRGRPPPWPLYPSFKIQIFAYNFPYELVEKVPGFPSIGQLISQYFGGIFKAALETA